MYPSVRTFIAGADRPIADISLAEKIAAGAITGSAGSGLANPFDVIERCSNAFRPHPQPPQPPSQLRS